METKKQETAIQTTPAPEQKRESTAMEKITEYLELPAAIERFKKVVGDDRAGAYLTAVVVAVKNSEGLQKCTPASIFYAAVQSATFNLTVDPTTGDAYLVPYKDKAQFIIGYHGLYTLAMRTGRYRYINVGPVYEGQVVEEDQITGFHSISGKIAVKDDAHIIGWIGAFEMLGEHGGLGFAKTFYMTVEEIHEHAKKYSQNYYGDRSLWNPQYKKNEIRKMERKTALRLLLRRWGYIDPFLKAKLDEVEGVPESESRLPDIPAYDEVENLSEEPAAEPVKRTREENLHDLGFDKKSETPAPAAKPRPSEPTYAFNDEKIVKVIAGLWNISTKDTVAALWKAHNDGRLPDTLTVGQATRIGKIGVEKALAPDEKDNSVPA